MDPMNIILQYFPPIYLPADPETLEYSSEADSSDYEINDTVDKCQLEADSMNTSNPEEDKLVLTPEADCVKDLDQIDNPDLASDMDQMRIEREPEPTGIDALVNQYGLQGVKDNIFNAITEYSPEHMLRLLHSYQQEVDRTTTKSHRRILINEITKLEKQVFQQERIYKRHLINVMLHCPQSDENRMAVQKNKLLEFLTLDQLTEIIIEMKDMANVIQQRSELKGVLQNFSGGETFRTICKKLLQENTWNYVQKLLMPIEAERGDCGICFAFPKQYLIKDCCHYYLCKRCKRITETNDDPQCAICRTKITQFIRVFEV